jgi:hypothetical protein
MKNLEATWINKYLGSLCEAVVCLFVFLHTFDCCTFHQRNVGHDSLSLTLQLGRALILSAVGFCGLS